MVKEASNITDCRRASDKANNQGQFKKKQMENKEMSCKLNRTMKLVITTANELGIELKRTNKKFSGFVVIRECRYREISMILLKDENNGWWISASSFGEKTWDYRLVSKENSGTNIVNWFNTILTLLVSNRSTLELVG